MSSHSPQKSGDSVRSYKSVLQELNSHKYHRVLPKPAPKGRVYKPNGTVSTTDAVPVFVPLFYAGEKGALGIWDKCCGTGYVKRRLDDEERSYHVLEMSNARNNMGTYISAPRTALQALHITLPHLVIAMKNFRRNFGFDVLIMDSNAYRRRFSFATWHNAGSLKKYSFMCQVPLRLEIGWNEIHVNFNELVRNTYKTSYVETIRIQIYSNCKLRQVFFCDDRMMRGDVPIPSMKDFGNIRIVPLDYGPRTHPDGIEPGPEKKRNLPYIEPPAQIPLTRLEQDLKLLQKKRYAEVSKQRLALQPYKTYFRELILEEKQKRKLTNAVEAAIKKEKEAKVETNSGANKDNNENGASAAVPDTEGVNNNGSDGGSNGETGSNASKSQNSPELSRSASGKIWAEIEKNASNLTQDLAKLLQPKHPNPDKASLEEGVKKITEVAPLQLKD